MTLLNIISCSSHKEK